MFINGASTGEDLQTILEILNRKKQALSQYGKVRQPSSNNRNS